MSQIKIIKFCTAKSNHIGFFMQKNKCFNSIESFPVDLIRRINTLNTEKKEWLIVNFITNRYILIKQKTFDNNTKCSLLISIRVLNLLLLLQSCDATHAYISGWKKNLAPWNQNFCVGMSYSYHQWETPTKEIPAFSQFHGRKYPLL